jgi:hypothetical protein
MLFSHAQQVEMVLQAYARLMSTDKLTPSFQQAVTTGYNFFKRVFFLVSIYIFLGA